MQQYNKGFENVKQIAPKMKYNDAQDKEWATTRFFPHFANVQGSTWTKDQYHWCDVTITGTPESVSGIPMNVEIKRRNIDSTSYTETIIENDKIERIKENGPTTTHLLILFRDRIAWLPASRFWTSITHTGTAHGCPDEYQPGKWQQADKPVTYFGLYNFIMYDYKDF